MVNEEQVPAVIDMRPALEWAKDLGYAEAMTVLLGVEGMQTAHQLLLEHWCRTHPPQMVVTK